MAKSTKEKPQYIVNGTRMFRGKLLASGTAFDCAEVDCSDAEAEDWARKGYLVTAEEFAQQLSVTADEQTLTEAQ